MGQNRLLEILLGSFWDPEGLGARFYKTDPDPRFPDERGREGKIYGISGLHNMMKYGEEISQQEFGECVINSYTNELIAELGLKRGESAGPRPLQPSNWLYTKHVGPIYLEADLDVSGGISLDVTLLSPPEHVDRIVTISDAFFAEKLKLLQGDPPAWRIDRGGF
jgi:hypothetical protein